MKAERRHDLRENDLIHALQTARDYLDRHSRQIGLVVILALAAFGAVIFTLRSKAAAVEDIWRRKSLLSYETAETGKEALAALANMVRETADDRFIFESLVEQGQQALRLASQAPSPPDREFNDAARHAFEQLFQRFGDRPLALGIARMGLATVEENDFTLDGDPAHRERAEAHLSAIIENPALNALPLKRLALDRRKTLDTVFTTITFAQPIELEGPEAPENPEASEVNTITVPLGESGTTPIELSIPPIEVPPAEATPPAAQPAGSNAPVPDPPDQP